MKQKKENSMALLLHWAGEQKFWLFLAILLSMCSGLCIIVPYIGIYRLMDATFNNGIEIKHENVFRAVLADMVAEFCIASVKDAITTADALVHFADFSGFTPNVDESSLKSMITSWHNDAERSEVK